MDKKMLKRYFTRAHRAFKVIDCILNHRTSLKGLNFKGLTSYSIYSDIIKLSTKKKKRNMKNLKTLGNATTLMTNLW